MLNTDSDRLVEPSVAWEPNEDGTEPENEVYNETLAPSTTTSSSSRTSTSELTDFEKSLDTETYGYTPSLFHLSLPLTAIAYHYQLKYIYQKHEHPIFVYLKVIMYIYFLGVVLATVIMQTITLKIILAVSLLFVPGLLIIYTYALFNTKCMSGSRVGIIGATNRIQGREREEDNRGQGEQQVNIFNQEQALMDF